MSAAINRDSEITNMPQWQEQMGSRGHRARGNLINILDGDRQTGTQNHSSEALCPWSLGGERGSGTEMPPEPLSCLLPGALPPLGAQRMDGCGPVRPLLPWEPDALGRPVRERLPTHFGLAPCGLVGGPGEAPGHAGVCGCQCGPTGHSMQSSLGSVSQVPLRVKVTLRVAA